ncbi:MAG: hypothetical protein LBO09_09520 [Candidatus Peribacteria bacterium]|jgi:hypothetical protein|nr:hypothetical protein [Candidatus Peribacteria bacterium]
MTKIIAITPFFSSQEEFADNFSKLEETVKRLKEQTDTNLIGIINDAPKLELPYIYQDFTLSSPKTQGKE